MLIALLLSACTPTTSAEPEPCGDGFGRGDDGNCYPLAAGDTAEAGGEGGEGGGWGYVDMPCEGGEAGYNYQVTIETPGPPIALWGFYSDELLAYCAANPGTCRGVDAGVTAVELTLDAVSENMVYTYCNWFNGGTPEMQGYAYDPLRVYYLE